LLDTFAYFETHEGYDFGTGLLGQRTDFDFRILDERLLDQAGFSEELADAALDHVLDDIFRLAGNLVGVQRQENFLFLGHGFFGNLIRSDELRVAALNVHGNLTSLFAVTTLEGVQYANAMAVQVGTDYISFGAGQATDVDVFATLGNQGFASRLHVGDQRSSIAVTCGERFFDALCDKRLEIFLQGQEVSLRVDFDDHGRLAILSNLDCDGTFGGDVASLLGSLDGTSGAHVVDGLFDIATG